MEGRSLYSYGGRGVRGGELVTVHSFCGVILAHVDIMLMQVYRVTVFPPWLGVLKVKDGNDLARLPPTSMDVHVCLSRSHDFHLQ